MSLSLYKTNEPQFPSKSEVVLARESSRKLAGYLQSEEVLDLRIQDKKGREANIELPSSIVRLLMDMLEQMADGNAVTILPVHTELTTRQAAGLLGVSRPFLIKLLDEGHISFRKVGSHRRIKLEDLLIYKQESYVKRSQILDELTAEAQELNLGYE